MARWDISTAVGPSRSSGPESMFVRIRAPIPAEHLGADIRFYGAGDDGFFYYCKDDNGRRPTRATEAFSASLAEHLGIAAAPWGAVEVEGQLLFGSRQHPSTEERSAVVSFCYSPERDEIGALLPWRGSYFARLFILDAFLGNVDRQACNLVGYRDGRTLHVRAIDFAASSLLDEPGVDIRLNDSQTLHFWRIIRQIHGGGGEAAIEMVERLGSIPTSFVESALDRMPSEWLDGAQVRRLLEFWGGGERIERLARLGEGLKDGSLL